MSIGVQVWSTTASNNSTADTNINWAEGMAPSQVNDSARAKMASVAKFRDDNNGTIATGGTTAAYTVTSNQVAAALTDGYTVTVKFHATNDSSATLAQDGLAARNLQVIAGTNVSSGVFLANSIHRFKYDSGSTAWIAQGGNLIDASGVGTLQIADTAVTYQKLQTPGASALLGNPSTSTSTGYREVTLGSGLQFSGTTITAPAFPPTTAFKNLILKVTGNSSATGAADLITMATAASSAFQTVALNGSVTISSGASGAAGGIDVSGSPASNTWYAAWAISTAASTLAQLLLSTSFTTPLLPGAYTYKARIGAINTTTTTATPTLYGTWQFNRTAQYVAGLAGSPANHAPQMTTSTSTMAALSVGPFVPTATASRISIAINAAAGAGNAQAAPNSSYPSTLAPIYMNGAAAAMAAPYTLTLESTNIYYASNDSRILLHCLGWEDNI